MNYDLIIIALLILNAIILISVVFAYYVLRLIRKELRE